MPKNSKNKTPKSDSESDNDSSVNETENGADLGLETPFRKMTLKQSNPEWSDDSGDEGLGKIENIQRKFFSYFGGNKESTTLYIPDSKAARPETAKETKGQGDHIIPFAFLSYVIMASLKGSNIKTLDTQFNVMLATVLPERNEAREEKKEVKEKRDKLNTSKGLLTEKFKKYRETRKNSTGAIRQISAELALETKKHLQESNRRTIREDIDGVASDLIELLNILPEAAFPKSRQENSNIEFKVASGATISESLGFLIDFDELLQRTVAITQEELLANGASGVQLGTALGKISPNGKKGGHDNRSVKPREALAKRLNNKFIGQNPQLDNLEKARLITSLSCLIDYPRTGVEGEDDEKVLYNTIARLFVMTFNTFQGLAKYTKEEKEALYDGFFDKVLIEQGWIDGKNKEDKTSSTHQIKDGEATKPITKKIVMDEVAKIASLDFGANKFKMLSTQKDSVRKKLNFDSPTKADTKESASKYNNLMEEPENKSPSPSPSKSPSLTKSETKSSINGKMFNKKDLGKQ